MGRRRSVDFVGWGLYRRAWLLPALALIVVLVTSFRPEAPVTSTLPPTLQNERAAELLTRSETFAKRFADRRPGTPGAIDSANWMRDEFDALGLRVGTVPATTTNPANGRSLGLVNVEATLAGRTRELVVVMAHRDTLDARGRGGDATGQLALLALAEELAATRDRRRSYLFVSTDGATLNGAGARSLAERLQTRGGVVAVIAMDRLGGAEHLRVDASPSGKHAPPLGLVQAARGAVSEEVGAAPAGSLGAQLVRLAAPLTLREHGQLLRVGLPALTITAADDQLRSSADAGVDPAELGAGLRSVQRLVGTLDQLDRLQSAGKTWVAGEQRVYRGWALKILVATLLVPVWVAMIDLLVRRRRGWNLVAAVGTCCRAMLAGIWSIALLWLFGGIGLLPSTSDRPPNPGALDDVHWIGLLLWALLTVAGWLLARGPDWRRSVDRTPTRRTLGHDTPDLVVALGLLVVLSALALAISPYTVLFAVPALHAWLWLCSLRVFQPAARLVVWTVGLVGPLLALVAVAARADAGAGAGWYALQLLQSRTVPGSLGLLLGAAAGLGVLVLVAATGRVAHPALPRLRDRWAGLQDRSVPLIARDQLDQVVRRLRARRSAARLLPVARRRAPARSDASRGRRRTTGAQPHDETQARLERERRRAARASVKSR